MSASKVIAVIGGAGLLGRQFCAGIADGGDLAIIADRDLAAAEEATANLSADRRIGRVEAAQVDITRSASVDDLIRSLAQRHHRVDAVVNCAYPRNSRYGRRVEEVSYADFCENVSLHLGGYFLVAQRFGLHFRAQGGGNIVQLASVYGAIAPRFEIYDGTAMTMPVEYAAIKAGILQLTRYFAAYFKKDGVRVNALSPGGIRDRQDPAFQSRYDAHCGRKGMLDAADVVGSLRYLLSDASRNVTGQNLVVDDGFSL